MAKHNESVILKNNNVINLYEATNETLVVNTNHNPMECRICLSGEEAVESGPLIAPCKCIGSVQFVHKECLKMWLMRQVKEMGNNAQAKYFKNGIKCELCHETVSAQLSETRKCSKLEESKSLIC
jgi:hypothetical protein